MIHGVVEGTYPSGVVGPIGEYTAVGSSLGEATTNSAAARAADPGAGHGAGGDAVMYYGFACGRPAGRLAAVDLVESECDGHAGR